MSKQRKRFFFADMLVSCDGTMVPGTQQSPWDELCGILNEDAYVLLTHDEKFVIERLRSSSGGFTIPIGANTIRVLANTGIDFKFHNTQSFNKDHLRRVRSILNVSCTNYVLPSWKDSSRPEIIVLHQMHEHNLKYTLLYLK